MDLGKTLVERERTKRLRFYQANLYALCTEVLGYDKLTEAFHRPMLDDIDAQRREGVKRSMELWPRGHYKTTVRIGQMVQDLLIDPDGTALVSHAVEDEVHKIVEEAGQHFQKNKELRALRPECMPSSLDRRFLKSLEFTIKRSRYNRQPSVLGKSSNSEITGAHVDVVYLDDIVGRNTIDDSGLPKVKSWFRSTILPVLNPGGAIWVTGTRWDIEDPYGMWLKQKRWRCRVRAALETNGEPDYKGEPVLFGTRELQHRQTDMGPSDFAHQMMNDPSPAGEKPWDPSKCEHYMTLREAASQPGEGASLVVLSDPAPARVGSLAGKKETERADGTKDDWATCVIKIRTRGQRQEFILIDGTFSKDWDHATGLDECARLMNKYSTSKVGIEAIGGLAAHYEDGMQRAARKAGTPGFLWIKFKSINIANAKNVRFATLASIAREQRFYICETCPREFVDRFLEQARNWREVGRGRNANRFDDVADVVSRCTDPAVQEFAPQATFVTGDFWNDQDADSRAEMIRSRYCAI
jgi:hypothetical protein